MKSLDLFLLACCLCSLSTLGGATDIEQALMKKLFATYNLKVRPAASPEEKVVVRVGMMLSSFVGLNMKNEEMSTIVVMNLEWTDHRLSWKPKEHDGIEVLRIPSGKVWLPDIVLINNNDGVFGEKMGLSISVLLTLTVFLLLLADKIPRDFTGRPHRRPTSSLFTMIWYLLRHPQWSSLNLHHRSLTPTRCPCGS
ncbi:acetylcholine receptor subunit beta-like protein [Lates japonicus]|uniref:Acetylcholine receptor subunit beta-like protein n=1 Tax=Lates japonicus TaxID=270547 RepID=A0AAD3NN38_LATJO|nr:acetylcholine receptor subunit beta-like protein [Lates japonicus]